ncbi:MAG: aminotransferase class I/II-fold pyridoxal phosphate-dependent enzyme [Phycisphaerales bacterium]
MTDFNPLESLANMRHEFGEHGGVNMSIEASTTFTVLEAETMPEIFQGRRGPEAGGCYLYGRHFNPTVYVLGRQLAALEGTEAGYATASGMSAIAATVLQLCERDDHVLASRTIYGGTFAFFENFLPSRTGISVDFIDATDLDAVRAAITDRTRLLFVETIANPTLQVSDIAALAAIAHERHVKLVVDNTFAPLIVSPARHGADVVVHSLTKFISGGSDIIAGCVCGSQDLISDMMSVHEGALMLLGPTLDPKTAFELSLRIPHLGLRVAEHSRRAQVFAERLAELGVKVVYPGLRNHPGHHALKRQMNEGFGYGGLISIDLETQDRAYEFMETLQNEDRFGYMAVSLGYFDTLMSASASSTSSEMPEAERDIAGVSPGLVRISVGYTGSLEQRWRQLEDALRQMELV